MNKQLSKYIAIGLGVALFGFLCWYFSNIVAYILIAAVLSLMGAPLVKVLKKIRIGKWTVPSGLAALISLLCIIGAMVGFFSFFGPIFADVATSMYSIDLEQLTQKMQPALDKLNQFLPKVYPDFTEDLTFSSLMSSTLSSILDVGRAEAFFSAVAETTVQVLVGLFIVLFITYYFLREDKIFSSMVTSLFPDKYEKNVRRALGNSTHLLERYFLGILIEAAAITILNTLGLTLLCGFSFRLAVVLAFLAGVINVVPYIGPVFGGAVGVLVGTVNYYHMGGMPHQTIIVHLLLIVLVYFVTHMVDVFFFQPNIYSKSVKAHPLEIFLVILVGGSIGGIVGMLVAIPTYTVVRVFASEFLYHFKVVRKLTGQFRESDPSKPEPI